MTAGSSPFRSPTRPPPSGPGSRIANIVDRTTANFETDYTDAGPGAWSSDGRYLIVNEQWEDGTAWVVDPWSGSGTPIAGAEGFLDGGCFMSNDVVAHRIWNVGYGQGAARVGVIRLTDLTSGSTVTELGTNLFGDGLRCHADGSVTFVRRGMVDIEHAPGFSQPEPDYDTPVELVHLAPDGTATIRDSGDLRNGLNTSLAAGQLILYEALAAPDPGQAARRSIADRITGTPRGLCSSRWLAYPPSVWWGSPMADRRGRHLAGDR